MCVCSVTQSRPTLCDPVDCSPPVSSVHGISQDRFFPGKNTGVVCHFQLQGIFLTQGLNPRLLHWQADSLPVSPGRYMIIPIDCFSIVKGMLTLCMEREKDEEAGLWALGGQRLSLMLVWLLRTPGGTLCTLERGEHFGHKLRAGGGFKKDWKSLSLRVHSCLKIEWQCNISCSWTCLLGRHFWALTVPPPGSSFPLSTNLCKNKSRFIF